jgi:hypothetical protein
MSTAQVANAGIASGPIRVAQRLPVATTLEPVEPVIGSYAAPARDQTPRFADEGHEYDNRRRNSPYGPFQDRVVSFGGVLVSREVGTTIMQAQAATAARAVLPVAVEAERNVAVYEFNQALMGSAQVSTSIGLSR